MPAQVPIPPELRARVDALIKQMADARAAVPHAADDDQLTAKERQRWQAAELGHAIRFAVPDALRLSGLHEPGQK